MNPKRIEHHAKEKTASIIIIGASLAGLYAAWQLEQQGHSTYHVLEARTRAGGRIRSLQMPDIDMLSSSDTRRYRFDMGPSWFWPEYQPELTSLIQDLQLPYFAQHEDGDMMFEESPHRAALRTTGYKNAPASMRLEQGAESLIDSLLKHIPKERLSYDQTVSSVTMHANDRISIESYDSHGQRQLRTAEHVLLALPPRLASKRIRWEPALPLPLVEQWQNTATWMAPHAKYMAIYAEPFWRAQGLSGEGRSRCGPMAEIHDASAPQGYGALFGFLGIHAATRRQIPEHTLRLYCREQMSRLFGSQAAQPLYDAVYDWAQEPLTTTADDLTDESGHHMPSPDTTPSTSVWTHRIQGIASEWSPGFPGYMAGAIEAARSGVAQIMSHYHMV